MIRIIGCLFLVFFSNLAQAQIQTQTLEYFSDANSFKQLDNYYGGISLGYNNIGLLTGSETSGDFINTFSVGDDTSLSWKALAGFHYNANLDLEFAYQDLGAFEQDLDVVNNSDLSSADITSKLAYQSVSLEARPFYRWGEHFYLQGLLGLSYLSVDRENSGTQTVALITEPSTVADTSDSEVALIYGVAAGFNFLQNWSLRFDLSFTELDDEPLTLHQLGLSRSLSSK